MTIDPRLAALEKRVAELEAFAREQMAESIALGVTLQALLAAAPQREALRAAVAAQAVVWESGGEAVQVPAAIRMLVLPRLRALRDAI